MRANLPSDVVRILPWEKVTNGPTGGMPADFWQKIGAAASTLVNSLVYVGQLFYKGLVALVTFLVNLAEAIWDWGMRVWGAVQNEVAEFVEAAQSALDELASWVEDAVAALVDAFMDYVLQPLVDRINGLSDSLRLLALASRGVRGPSGGWEHSNHDAFLAALEVVILAIADFVTVIAVLRAAVAAIDIGLSIFQFTGVGAIAIVAAQVAIMAAFAVLGNHLVMAVGDIVSQHIAPYLPVVSLFLAMIGVTVATFALLTEEWTTVTQSVLVADFKEYGNVVDKAKIRPVCTTNVQRVHKIERGSGSALLLAIMSFSLVSLQLLLSSDMDPWLRLAVSVLLDILAIGVAVAAIFEAVGASPITAFGRWSRTLAPISLGVAIAAFGVDYVALRDHEAGG